MAGSDDLEWVRRLYEDVWNRGDYSAVERINAIAPSDQPELFDILAVTNDETRAGVEMFRAAFPDMTLRVEGVVDYGDAVAARFTVQGTHTEPLMGVAPTYEQVTITGTSLLHMEGGQIATGGVREEQWSAITDPGLAAVLNELPGRRGPKRKP